jgi:hypothetical protein
MAHAMLDGMGVPKSAVLGNRLPSTRLKTLRLRLDWLAKRYDDTRKLLDSYYEEESDG